VRALLPLAILIAFAAPARSQESATDLIAAARAQLDLAQADSALALLDRALRARPAREAQARAWVLWGIAQLVRGQMAGTDLRAAAQQGFRQALAISPAERVDSLDIFGDDVVRLFNAERAALAPAVATPFAVEIRFPADTVVPPAGGELRLEARPSHPARIFVSVEPEGAPSSVLWADTVQTRGTTALGWNLRLGDNTLVSEGRYVLRAVAADSLQQRSLPVEISFAVSRAAADTQPLPPPVAEADLAPETMTLKRGAPSILLWGAGLAAMIAVAPSVMGNGDLNTGGADGTAYAVAGGVSLASVVAFLRGSRVRPVPENIERNRQLRDRNAQQRIAAERANAAARENAGVIIQVLR